MHSKINEPVSAIFKKKQNSKAQLTQFKTEEWVLSKWLTKSQSNTFHTRKKNVPRNMKKEKPKYDYRNQRLEHLR